MSEFQYSDIKYKFTTFSEDDHIYKMIKKSNNFYEIGLLKTISDLNLGGIYVDVGSNIGNHTIYFSNHCKSEEVYSFEIHPIIFNILEINIKNNVLNKQKCHLFNIGVGETKKMVSLSDIDNLNVGMTKIISEDGNFLVDKLDSLLYNINNISLIKIDVEGYELNVLMGSINTIKKHKPVIIAECRDGDEFNEINEFLIKYNYHTNKLNLAKTPTYLWKYKI